MCMDYFKSLLLSMNYIEKNLKTEICIDDLAAISFFSIYHYQRVFQSYNGKPVMEYVKERRLMSAALELVNSSKKVSDIALEYYFYNPETFIRSFNKAFGITPGKFRNKNLSDLLKKRFLIDSNIIQYEGDETMLPNVKTNSENGENYVNVPKFWDNSTNPDETVLELTLREFELIMFLILNQGNIISRDNLLKKIWGNHYNGDCRVVDATVRSIREKLETEPSNPYYIRTKRCEGYYFLKQVN